MRLILVCALGAIGLLLPAHDAAAHGLTVRLEQRGDVVIATGRYDGGIPVREADVVIRAPGQETPFQSGRTDPEGRFAFVAAGSGEWRVTVDDGMGHRRTASIVVADPEPDAAADVAPAAVTERDPASTTPGGVAGGGGREASSPVDDTRRWRLATGLSLLFGLTGFGYGYTARARGRSVAG
jgi:hypothetical protein